MKRAWKKRLLTLALALALCMAMMLPGFAAEASTMSATGESFSTVVNSNYQLNAYTWGTPTIGTKLTLYGNIDNDNSQRWVPTIFPGTSYYYIKNAANTDVTIAYTGRGVQADLRTVSILPEGEKTQAIKLVDEKAAKWGMVLPQYLCALTAGSIANGGAVTWESPNGQNNQLWYRGLHA